MSWTKISKNTDGFAQITKQIDEFIPITKQSDEFAKIDKLSLSRGGWFFDGWFEVGWFEDVNVWEVLPKVITTWIDL